MSLYDGPPIATSSAAVRLIAPNISVVHERLRSADLVEHQKAWIELAQVDGACLYFSIAIGGEVAGQIGLHDIEPSARQAMVGYHIFQKPIAAMATERPRLMRCAPTRARRFGFTP